MPGSFAWFDLVSNRPDQAEAFYGALFGWDFADGSSSEYRDISSNGVLLGGISGIENGADPKMVSSQWTPVLTLADPVEATRRALAAGGEQVGSPFRIGDTLFSRVRDNRGALLVIQNGPDGFPLDAAGQAGVWGWADLFVDNPSRARSFYRSVAGFETRQDGDVTVFERDGLERGGLVGVPDNQLGSTWIPYVGVASISETVARAQELGGTQLALEDRAALIIDPTGAVIGLIAAEES